MLVYLLAVTVLCASLVNAVNVKAGIPVFEDDASKAEERRVERALEELLSKSHTRMFTVIDSEECAQIVEVFPADGHVEAAGDCLPSGFCNVRALTCYGEGANTKFFAFGDHYTGGECLANGFDLAAFKTVGTLDQLGESYKAQKFTIATGGAGNPNWGVTGAAWSKHNPDQLLFGLYDVATGSSLTAGLNAWTGSLTDPTKGAPQTRGPTPFAEDDGGIAISKSGTLFQAKREERVEADAEGTSKKHVVALRALRQSNGFRTALGPDLKFPDAVTFMHTDEDGNPHNFQETVTAMAFDPETNELYAVVRTIGNPFNFMPGTHNVHTYILSKIDSQTGEVQFINSLPQGSRSLTICRTRTDEQADAYLKHVLSKAPIEE